MDDGKKSLADKIMGEIRINELSPRSRFYFLKRKMILWTSILFTIFLGGHSLGVLFYFFSDFDFSLLPIFLRTSGKMYILIGVLTWFSFLVAAGVWTFFRYRKTDRGYRLDNVKLIAFVVLSICFVGFVSHKTESSLFFEKTFNQFIPYYQSWEASKINIWSQPKEGLLAGTIQEVNLPISIQIRDMTGKVWLIDMNTVFVRRRAQIKIGAVIKILGEADEQGFVAKEIRPWRGKGSRHRSCYGASDKKNCIERPR